MKTKNSADLICSIKNHPNNKVLTLLAALGWTETRGGSNPQGNCITGHGSESQTCMRVFEDSNNCFCFSCQNSFDAFDIAMKIKSMDFKQALSWLANRAGIAIRDELSNEQRIAIASAERTQEILRQATSFWNSALIANSEMMEILTKRYGLSNETVIKNKIGLCSIDTATFAYLKDLGFSDIEIQRSGIVFPEGKGFPKEFFEGRLIFPYLQSDQPVYLVGRKTHLPTRPGQHGDDDSGKYVKQPTANGNFKDVIDPFISGTAIFGEDTILDSDKVVIAEGVTDCLAAQQLGLASISPVTTGFSGHQLHRLIDLLKDKTVLVTGDSEPNLAGEKGAWKTTEKLIEHGIDVWFAKIPDLDTSHRPRIDVPDIFKYPVGKTDLNDIINALGAEGFTAVKRESVPGYKALVKRTFPNIENARQQTKVVTGVFWKLTNYDSDRYIEMTNWFIDQAFGTKETQASKAMREAIEKVFKMAAAKKRREKQHEQIAEQRTKMVVLNNEIPRKSVVEDFSNFISQAPDVYRFGNQLTFATMTNLQPIQKISVLPSYFAKNIAEAGIVSFDDYDNMHIDHKQLPDWLAASAVESPWQHPTIREIEHYTNGPTFDELMVLSSPGYNSSSKIFYAGTKLKPHADFSIFDSFIDDWPWKETASRTNFISLLLLGTLKHQFPGNSPAGLAIGNQSGVGKTFLAFFYSLLFEQKFAKPVPFIANEEELQKQIVTELMSGSNTILIDNIRVKNISSGTLESMLTAPRLNFRLLGKNVGINRLNTIQTFLTLNEGEVSADLLNRSVPMHLEFIGDPNKRQWKRIDFRKDVLASREKLLGTLIQMVENWKEAKMQRSTVKHRFSDCVSLVGGILEVNGYKDFLANADSVKAERDPMRAGFLEMTEYLELGKKYSAKNLLDIADRNGVFRTETQYGDGVAPKSRTTKLAGILMRFCGVNQRFTSERHKRQIVMKREHDSSLNQQVYRLLTVEADGSPDLKNDSGEVRQDDFDFESGT